MYILDYVIMLEMLLGSTFLDYLGKLYVKPTHDACVN